MIKYLFLPVLLILTISGYAESLQDSTKSSYNLFHPCPRDQLRSFETDRPDATESPYTVDAGHFQFETDLFKTDRLSVNGVKTVTNSFNNFNLKAGLTNSLDIQFISESFIDTRIINGSSPETGTSFSNITIRAKQNIWGNDKGRTAMAILPFVNIPTVPNVKITGGVVFPFSIALPHDWSCGTQFELDIEDDQAGNGYHINPLVSATFSHAIISKINFFTEVLMTRDNELNRYESFLDAGLVYTWKKNLKFDAGVYYGLKSTSSKVYFIGLSFRH